MQAGSAQGQRSVEALQEALGERFEVKRVLGHGSMATVYLAKDSNLERLVAIKVPLPEPARDEVARRRFEREARAAASLSHPKIVTVHEFGRLPDQTPFLVMEFVKGRSMNERLEAQGPLPEETAIEVLSDVASALAAAHAKGIVHRDLRPANILWNESGDQAFLADFGIAALVETSGEEITKLTEAGQLIGDPRYVSPEQLREEPVSELSDIYGFGVLGYELLTGEGPYGNLSDTEWLTAHRNATPRDLRDLRPGIDPNIAALLKRCLHKEPRRRPSASDILRGLSGQWRLEPQSERVWAKILRRRLPQALTGAAVVNVGVVEGVSTLIERGRLPEVGFSLALVFGIAAICASAVVAWFHGDRGFHRPTVAESALLGGIALGWVVASVLIVL